MLLFKTNLNVNNIFVCVGKGIKVFAYEAGFVRGQVCQQDTSVILRKKIGNE